jgi:hypothetical protein
MTPQKRSVILELYNNVLEENAASVFRVELIKLLQQRRS